MSVAVVEAGGFYPQDDDNLSPVPADCLVNARSDVPNPQNLWSLVKSATNGQ